MSYQTQADLAHDAAFQDRVSVALARTCVSVQNESVAIPDHPARAIFAYGVLQNLPAFIPRFALTITSNNLIMIASVSDADLQTALDVVFYAFVKPNV